MATKTMTAVAKAQEEPKEVSRLDKSQVSKGSKALLKHIKEAKESQSNKNLLEVGNEGSASNSVPIWLIFNTKKHVTDKNRLKPGKIPIPHSLNRPDSSICLITADPQRAFKDVIEEETFPSTLRSQIRVLGLEKLKKRYKSYEQKRQLIAEYDTFLADDRIITSLPALLGKTAYQSSKRPMPIDLKPSNEPKEKRVLGKKPNKDVSQRKTPPATTLAKRIESALSSARVHLAPSASTSVHVGFSHFTPKQLDENIVAVIDGMAEKFIPQGWKNVKSLHIKGPETLAFPIWQTTELWIQEDEVLEDKDAEAKKAIAYNGKRKHGTEDKAQTKRPKLLGDETGFSPEMEARRQALREAKKESKESQAPKSVKVEKKTVRSVSDGKIKTKSTKLRSVSASA